MSGLLQSTRTRAGIPALPYHAGLDAGVRARNQDRFINEDGVVIVATIAFGMGIGGQLDHPLLVEAQRRGAEAARAAGKPFMQSLSSVGLDRTMPIALEQGYTMFMLSADTSLFTEGVRTLVDIADGAIQNASPAPARSKISA